MILISSFFDHLAEARAVFAQDGMAYPKHLSMRFPMREVAKRLGELGGHTVGRVDTRHGALTPINLAIVTDKCAAFLVRHRRTQIGRNHKCPCGSGKRFKKCHLEVQTSFSPAQSGSS